MKSKPTPTTLSEKQRAEAINRIISFFLDERDEEIGIIAATEILEFFESEVAPFVYRNAINDSKKLVEEQMQQLVLQLTEKTLE